MDPALKRYNRKSTMMAESIDTLDFYEYPVFVICPQPGFKPSFFQKMNLLSERNMGIDRYIWETRFHRNKLRVFICFLSLTILIILSQINLSQNMMTKIMCTPS